jgi:DNA-binding FadR family transcriptional regulator
MSFDLQFDIPDRALPDAFRTFLVQQTEALEVLLQYAHDTKEAIRANGHLSLQEKTMQIDALAKEVSERLIALEDQHRQMWAQLEIFQQLLRQQRNLILAHTVERVKEVLEQNLTMAKQGLDAIIHGHSPSWKEPTCYPPCADMYS